LFVVLDPKQADATRLMDAAPGYHVFMSGSKAGEEQDHRTFVRTVVLSRIPIAHVDHPADAAFGRSAVELTTTGPAATSVVVFGTDSPTTPARAQQRDRVLDAAARWSNTHSGRRIVMGDFNATPWSPTFQRLLHRGHLFNSLDGFGLQVSWPESNVLLRIPIDHALLGPALAATDRGTGPAFGSQHRSLRLTVTDRRP
jgi:endonuclease/exonuclease/phosphatase (EEP) superfamily protein YafD